MSIVLRKGNHTTAPVSREEAQKLVNEGYEVWINKGAKLEKKAKATPKKASKKKAEDE